VTRWRYR